MKKEITQNFDKLFRFYFDLGWYSGRVDLIKCTFQGEFEGFTHRATEDWEHRWILECAEVKRNGELHVTIPAIRIEGERFETLDDLAAKALEILAPYLITHNV